MSAADTVKAALSNSASIILVKTVVPTVGIRLEYVTASKRVSATLQVRSDKGHGSQYLGGAFERLSECWLHRDKDLGHYCFWVGTVCFALPEPELERLAEHLGIKIDEAEPLGNIVGGGATCQS